MNYNTNPRLRAPVHRPATGTARGSLKQKPKYDPDNLPVIEIIKNRLYWTSG